MLWHGAGACRRGGQALPVSVGTLPTRVPAAQPGPPPGERGPRRSVRQAGPGAAHPRPRRAVAQLARLRTPEGTTALARRRGALAERVDVLPGAGPAARRGGRRARRPGLGAGPAAGPRPAGLRRRRRRPVPDRRHPRAGRPPVLAARRAARLLAGGARVVADLGCAAGTDTVALARAGAEVVAVDRDPLARALTAANVEALGLAGRVRVVDADVVDLVARGGRRPGRGCAAATLDPARRAGGRRQLDPDRWSPPWTTVAAAAGPGAAGGREGGAGPRPRPRARRRRGRVGVGRRLDRRGAAVGARAGRDVAAGDAGARRRDARGDRRRRPGPGAARAGPRVAARARPGADPVGADVAGRRRPRRDPDRPDDRLPDLRRARPTAPGSAPTGSTRCCRSTSRSSRRCCGPAASAGSWSRSAGSPIEPEALARQLRGPGTAPPSSSSPGSPGHPPSWLC